MEDLVASLADGPDDDGHGFASLINPKELTFERLPALETAFLVSFDRQRLRSMSLSRLGPAGGTGWRASWHRGYGA
jgi:hypothetical protein